MIYRAKVKYHEEDYSGQLKTKVESYLVSALSYGDVEAKLLEHFPVNMPEYQTTISKKPLAEVFDSSDEDMFFFQAKVDYLTFNEKIQKEKRSAHIMVVKEKSVDTAFQRLKNVLGTLNDYEIVSVAKTDIVEVIK